MDSVAPVRYPQNAIQRPATNNWLDRPLLDTVTLDCEKALYALFILLALLSRLWDLGQRVMSHDETVHGQWSWYLYQGHGYAHHPLSHGPFLFHSTALTYYLFGDSEFTARLVPALMGVMLVALPYTLRRWLGRSGALVAAFLLLISPSLLYYSRYARNDVPIIVWSAIAVVAILRYLEASQNRGPIDRRSRWLIVLAASLVLMFATKEVAFFYIAIFGSFLVVLFFVRLGKPRRGTPSWEQWARIWLTVGGLVVVILVATGLLLSSFFLVELFPMRYRDCGQAPVPDVASGEMRCSEGGCRLIQGRCQRPLPIVASEDVFEFDQTGARVAIRLTQLEILIVVVLIGAIAVLAGGGAYAVLKRVMPLQPPSPGSPSTSSGRLASPSTGSGRGPSTGSGRGPSTGFVQHPERSEWAGGERPVLGLILFIGSFTLPFLSHLAISGLSRLYSRLLFGIDAAFNSLDYSEAGLLRSAGFVFILLAVSVAVGLWWDWRRWLAAAGVFYGIYVVLFSTVFTNGNGLASGMVGSLGYWLEQQAVERGSQPVYYYGLLVPLYEYLPLVGCGAAALYVLLRGNRARGERKAHSLPTWILFLLFWTALTWPIYSVAGERMPWMTVHLAAPMILASGWIIGKFIESANWRDLLLRGGWIVPLIVPIGLAALVQTVSPWLTDAGRPKPFSGYGVGQLNTTLQFLSALFVLSITLALLYRVWQRVGTTGLRQVLTALALGALAVLTIRTSWALAYLNYDNASEFLVYAHGSPEVRVVMEQVEEISRRTSGERSLDIGYTADGSYPIMWYLRNYRNALQLPNPPSRADLDKSVILAGDKEWGGIEPYLGENHVCNHYNFMWWPMQDYAGLSWERIRYALINPQMRGAVWDIVFRRDYRKYERATGKTVRLSEWPLRNGFRFCVRRDLIPRVWSERAGSIEFLSEPDEVSTLASSYATLEQPAVAELEITTSGPFGSLNGPHGMALDADGFIYVADTNNHRIVKFSPEGEIVHTWDSTWWRGLESWKPNGCLDAANQPLASGEGEFCEPWGVAVGPAGRVYVADTWNHRVQVFTADGRFLAKVGSFGQSGGDALAAPAQFYGPRDVAVDQEGRVYVSDTGNKRIQVFDAELAFIRAFGGPGIVEGRLDEPVGLTIGPDRLLYTADTWNRRVQVFTLEGDFVRAWPIAGWKSQSVLNKPYVATDAVGHIYVSDPEGGRVIAFGSQGTPLAVLDLRGAGGNVPPTPVGVWLDKQERLWVSDAANHRLLRFPPVILAEPGEREYDQPQ